MSILKAVRKFHGGLKLPGHKSRSMTSGITNIPLPDELVIPMQQHIGQPAEPVVNVGDHVLTGQLIARTTSTVSAPVHASSSGEVVAIEERHFPHPSRLRTLCIVIKTDAEDKHVEYKATEPDNLSASALREVIHNAGIVGLGGAGFPAALKLNPPLENKIHTLILNGAECEPYISCDAMLMQSEAKKIIQGALFIKKALDIPDCMIGVEDNKPEAIKALDMAITGSGDTSIKLYRVPTRYPAGGEKQLVETLTGKQIPLGGLPSNIGVICHNIATAFSVAEAVIQGKPLIERVVTVTGQGVNKPQNLRVRFGTPIEHLLTHCAYQTDHTDRVLMGGPMMGFMLDDLSVPVIKTTNCILAESKAERGYVDSNKAPTLPCIRCGECARVCPAQLLPQQLYWYSRAKDLDKVQDYHVFECIECGCCDYVCPSHLPLVHYFRFAKTEVWNQEQDRIKSDKARLRHEFNQFRAERKKKEDEERKRKKRALLKKVQGDDSVDEEAAKKAAIEAALKRVQAKRDEQNAEAKNTDNLTQEQQQKIKEADARRKKLD